MDFLGHNSYCKEYNKTARVKIKEDGKIGAETIKALKLKKTSNLPSVRKTATQLKDELQQDEVREKPTIPWPQRYWIEEYPSEPDPLERIYESEIYKKY